MKAAVYHCPEKVRLEEVPLPRIKEEEVLVRVKVALTCGTDRKLYLRGHPLFPPPFILGHEFAGDIAKIGKGVKKFKKGMRVVAANSAPCHHCFYCKLGKEELCENFFIRLSGAFAEYIAIPEPIVRDNLFEIPKDITYQEAVFLEPLACVIHGIEESQIKLGDTVVINGAGPIGLLFLQLAKLQGARVIITDLSKGRLSLASKLGADKVLNVTQVKDEVKAVRELTEGKRGADIAIEAVGSPEVWEKTIAMVRRGGLVNLFGGCSPKTLIKIPTNLLHYNEVTIKGVFHHTPDYVRKAFALICDKSINTESLITQQFPLQKIKKVLELTTAQEGLKFAIIP
ncbi:MAG: zinc-binding dehydrogenase [Candidatus Omnitrophica bacterium]|nr:zinc-binding dehydrogenase [Candidatus Omnitrophota bacterium]